MRRAGFFGGFTVAACLLGTPVVAAHDAAVAPAAAVAQGGPAAGEEPQRLLEAGLGAARSGRPREALRALGTLVRRHQGTRWAGEGWLALGDQHLGSHDLTRARAAFEEARRSGDAAVTEAAAGRLASLEAAVRDETARLRAMARR